MTVDAVDTTEPWLPPSWTDYERRLLISHLMAGGLILEDDSGLGWATASRSLGGFHSDLVEHLMESGFRSGGERYGLAEVGHLPGRFGSVRLPPEPEKNLTETP
ncbi:MAG TPA: hypothetical protein VGG68_00905 [Caulobacteraceae bacterium]|jgi:hypothetical protein